ncbi:MAG: hypothetical protein SH856_02540 [Flavobacteriales bacterium]|nr:hypothetical protein [Flavobacteriales bacterium]
MILDKYDYVILDIIHAYKKEHKTELIKLTGIEKIFWTRIENDSSHDMNETQIGERITNLYLEGYLFNKQGYVLTKKGRMELVYQLEEQD